MSATATSPSGVAGNIPGLGTGILMQASNTDHFRALLKDISNFTSNNRESLNLPITQVIMVQLPVALTSASRAVLDKSTSEPAPSIPGLVYCVVDRQGEVLLSHASGKRGLDSPEPMTLDTTFWIASCTKMITSIACMQMVEQGKLALDDVDQVESLAPELKAVQVLERTSDGGFRLVPKDRGITLRMLMTHTGNVPSSGQYTQKEYIADLTLQLVLVMPSRT